VIDMVPFFVEANPRCQVMIPRINALAGALRAAGGTVAWVLPSGNDPHPELSDEFHGAAIADVYRRSGGDGPLPRRLCPGLVHGADDLFVEKTGVSAFFPGRCGLPDMLAARGIRTLIVAGTVTNVCCESTVRDARGLGYRVIMLADVNAAGSDAMHNATLLTVYRSFGDVRTTGEVLDLIAGAAP